MQRAGKLLFDDFHYNRRIARLRLADEQVEMLRHDDVSAYYEAMPLPHFLENVKKQIAAIRRAQDRPAMIATARNEVQMLQAVVSLELTGHDCRLSVAD